MEFVEADREAANAADSADIPGWLQKHVGTGYGQIAPVVLEIHAQDMGSAPLQAAALAILGIGALHVAIHALGMWDSVGQVAGPLSRHLYCVYFNRLSVCCSCCDSRCRLHIVRVWF